MGTQEKRNSISKVFSKLQMVSMLVIIAVFVANSIFVYLTERRNTVFEQSYQLQIAIEEPNARMRKTADEITDTLTAIRNNYNGIWTDEGGRKVLDKQNLNRYILYKKSVMDFLEYFFVFRLNDFTIFQGNDEATIFEHLAVKDYILENSSALVTTISKNCWQLRKMGGKDYAVLCYYYASMDIYVGVAIESELLFGEVIDLVKAANGSFEVVDCGENCFQFSPPDQQEHTGTIRLETSLNGGLELRAAIVADYLSLMRNDLILVTIVGFLLCFSTVYLMNRLLKKKVITPVASVSMAVRDIHDPAELQQIPENSDILEIHDLEAALNSLLKDAVYNRMQLFKSQVQKKEQELVMLRARIRPHFFLNAITTVSAMTYQNREEDIRTYLMRLSNFMRYTLTSSSETVSLHEELANIKNYFDMQDIKYPNRVMSFVECPKELDQIELPHFLLLTIVENAFKYALRADDMTQVFIQCAPVQEEGFSGVRIVIEDDGQGFSQEQLDYFNQPKLPRTDIDSHIGITNVKETLALYYGRDDLLHLSNAVPHGALIEIRIPNTAEKVGG